MSFLSMSLEQPVVRLADTATAQLSAMGARAVMDGADAAGRFALIEHPIMPRGLASPLHRHSREDEYSFILEGRWGFRLDDQVVYAEPGDLVYKPRDVWHAFWNASDSPARLLEIISPAGFEHYFGELADLLARTDRRDDPAFAALCDKYGLQMNLDSVPELVEAHQLTLRP